MRILFIILLFIYSNISYGKYEDYIKDNCSSCNEKVIYSNLVKVAKEYKLDKKVILAIMKIESRFISKASYKTNVGLMMVNTKWHTNKFKTTDYYNVYENIRVGSMIFKECKDKYKTLDLSLTCYKTGKVTKYILSVKNEIEEITKYE